METFKKTLPVAMGVIIGGLFLFGVYTFIQDHQKINSVISFLNTQIQASQQNSVTPAPVK